jgi:predicted RNA-binding Zn-ribbon protein involved in translation (DUF1610 family)
MSDQYWIRIGGKEVGPISHRDLSQMARNMEISPNTQLHSGDGEWGNASEVDGLFQLHGSKYCSTCGAQIREEAVVCPKCGCATERGKSQTSASTVSDGIVMASYLVGFLFPILGFVMAIYLMVKNRPGSGIGVAVVSLLSTAIWSLIYFGPMN